MEHGGLRRTTDGVAVKPSSGGCPGRLARPQWCGMTITRRTFLVGSAVGVAATTGLAPAQASGDSVTSWIARNAEPLGDLDHLRRSIGGAQIVGLGEAVHATAELTHLKLRVV